MLFSLSDLGSGEFFYGSATDYFIFTDNVDYVLYEIITSDGSVAFVSDALGVS